MEVTDEMINAVRAHVPAPCSKEKATLAVLGVLAIVEREPGPHAFQEYNEHGNDCHVRNCRLAHEEHL